MDRQAIINKFQQNPNVSVLIIGGGINGLGTFRDLALQGIDVLLVDKSDFCSGTSATSSRMVHGGIRYLENGEFRLVREAVKERNRLIKNAPHYVKPLATTIPIFKRLSGLLNAPLKFLNLLDRPGERGALVIKMGLMMYDAYTGGDKTVPRHKVLGRSKSLQQYPKLNPDVLYTATYYDAAMRDAERIAIEVMLDGEADNPAAHTLNYVSAVAATDDSVTLRDEESGDTFSVKPQLVINAAGPWIDFVNKALGTDTRFIGGTKGSHLVLYHPELHAACRGHEIFFENKDGRIVLLYPLFEDRVVVGTSDLKIDDPDQARCTDQEIDYFFELVDIVFPTIRVDRSHIVYQFSGVRPLPSSEANTTGQISRDHSNRIIEPGQGYSFPIFNLIGGKWTTYRAFSEQVADEALNRLGQIRRGYTKDEPIGGGRDYPHSETAQQAWISQVAGESGLSAERVGRLFDRYGTRAKEFAAYIAAGADRPLQHLPGYSTREVAFIAEREKVVHLTDFLQRRSLIAIMGLTTYDLIVELTAIIGAVLGWSEAQGEAEVKRTLEILAEYHGVRLIPRATVGA